MRGKLITIPFAGGNKYVYRSMWNASAAVDIFAAELPGRGNRIKEPLLTSFEDLVNDLFLHLQPVLKSPYVLFGHSLGAYLAYELTRQIQSRALPLPAKLFLSAATPPHEKHEFISGLPDREFIKRINLLGGIPDELAVNREFIEYITPVLKADFYALESYRTPDPAALPVPITVLTADDDKLTIRSGSDWSEYSSYPIEKIQFSGGHFFIFQNGDRILSLVQKTFNEIPDGVGR